MDDREMEIAARMAEAIKELPQEKKEWWLGYANGVIDTAERFRQSEHASA